MQTTWLALGLSLVASFADVLGGGLTVVRKLTEHQLAKISSIGAGFLLAATMLDRIPDTVSELPKSGIWIALLGFLVVLLLDASQRAREPVEVDTHVHSHDVVAISQAQGTAALMAFLVHTFMDGVVIAGAFAMNRAAGILMFIAITLHKVPEGLTMASLRLASKSTRRRAFFSSVLLAISTMVGAFAAVLFGDLGALWIKVVMAIATGTFLFVSASSVFSLIRSKDALSRFCFILLGALFCALSLILVHHVGLQ